MVPHNGFKMIHSNLFYVRATECVCVWVEVCKCMLSACQYVVRVAGKKWKAKRDFVGL